MEFLFVELVICLPSAFPEEIHVSQIQWIFFLCFFKLEKPLANCAQFQQREGGSSPDEPAHTNHAGEIQKQKYTNTKTQIYKYEPCRWNTKTKK